MQKNSNITKAEIEAKLIGQIASHTHAGGGGATLTSQLTNDSNFIVDPAYIHTDANYTTSEKTSVSLIPVNYAPVNAQKNSDITKAEIEAKLIGQIASHTHAVSGDIVKEYTAKLWQTGTTAPVAQFPYVDTLSVYSELDPSLARRFITYGRSLVGYYWIRVNWVAGQSYSIVSIGKLAISFSDRKCELSGAATGNDGVYDYIQFTFISYNEAGVVADSVLLNNTNVTLKLYA